MTKGPIDYGMTVGTCKQEGALTTLGDGLSVLVAVLVMLSVYQYDSGGWYRPNILLTPYTPTGTALQQAPQHRTAQHSLSNASDISAQHVLLHCIRHSPVLNTDCQVPFQH